MSRVLVTGSDGFIGRKLVPVLEGFGHTVLAGVRSADKSRQRCVEAVHIGDLRGRPSWSATLEGVDAVVHLAGRAHVTSDTESDPLSAFRAVNTRPTTELFEACQHAAVTRFIFVSTIGVNGIATNGVPFSEIDKPNPTEPYAVSKWEAEVALRQLAVKGRTQLVTIRPALIYGPNVKGNFLRLMSLIDSGWPLPFGSLTASRSVLGLTNFCCLIAQCMRHASPTPEVYVAADSQPISTSKLILALGAAMRRRVRLMRMAPRMLAIVGSSVGRRADIERLISSLEVDSSKARTVLNWQDKVSFSAELQAMADEYLK